MNDIVKHGVGGIPPAVFSPGGSPLAAPGTANVGAVTVESERAIAEARGQMQLAKMFPRDNTAAHAELMEACKSQSFAAVAFYAVPRGSNKVSGPSIRLAEEIARCYGNFEYGHRELSRDGGKSEIEVYAWDKEKNNRSIRQLTVQHTMDTKEGPKKLRDQKDIDDKISNVASKQVRGRILALVPKWLVEDAIAECRKTIAGNNDEPIGARVRKMAAAFAKLGVTAAMLERNLGHKLDDTTPDELVDLLGVYNAIKEGAPASEYFGADGEKTDKVADQIKDMAAASVPAGKAAKAQPAAAEPAPAAPAAKAAKTAPQPAPEVVPPPEPEPAPADEPAPGNEDFF